MTHAAALPARDVKAIGLISTGHFFSHLYFLILPPLFPLLYHELGVSYTALGLIVAGFNVASGVGQTPIGFLVDRMGGRALLIAGLLLQGLAIAAVGFAFSYWLIFVLFLIAGLANAVFHPADYSILSATVDRSRLGRAFGIHSFSGTLGFAAAPVAVVTLTAIWDWRTAITVLGLIGVAVGFVVWWQSGVLKDERPSAPREIEDTAPATWRSGLALLLSRPIMMAFIFFTLLAIGFGAIRMFSVSALVMHYDMPLASASGALTGFLIGAGAGILLGGVIADRYGNPARVAMLFLSASALLLIFIGSVSLPMILLVGVLTFTGFMSGLVYPSRDLLVRNATPEGDAGKVFGFVSTGLNVGSALTPLLFAWALDAGQPQVIFWLGGAVILLTLVTLTRVKPLRR